MVQGGDTLGIITFQGADGTNYVEGARIAAVSDNTASANDMPTRLVFYTTPDGAATPTERMTIRSGGSVLMSRADAALATTGHYFDSSGYVYHTRSGGNVLYLNRKSDDGDIATFYKSGGETGKIATHGGDIQIGTGNVNLFFNDGAASMEPRNSNGTRRDNAVDMGHTNARFDDIYATNGTIQTSDQNEKNAITDSDLGLDFIGRLSPKSYIFNNKTRTHYGLIAQDVESVLSDIGKTTSEFAGFIKDDISDDQDGSSYRYGLRYTEFVGPLIQAVKELKTKVETLETKVATLEGA